jgi:hypothetical protein
LDCGCDLRIKLNQLKSFAPDNLRDIAAPPPMFGMLARVFASIHSARWEKGSY